MGLAAAVIGAGVIGAGASIGTGLLQSHAASKATDAQVQSNQAAIGEQQREFDANQANLQPWLKAGQAGLGQYQTLIGGNGAGPQQAAITGLEGSPLYTSMIDQGDKAVLAHASATGGLRSGNVSDNLANFNANALNTVIQNQIGNLGQLSMLGSSTGGTLGSLGGNTANAIAQLLQSSGQAQAGGILAGAGALGGGINGGLSQLFGGISQAALMNQMNSATWGVPGSQGFVGSYNDTLPPY